MEIRKIIIIAFLIIPFCLFAQDKELQQISSENLPVLKRILKKYPKSDFNKDAILTEEEYRIFQLKDLKRKPKFKLKGYYSHFKNLSYGEHKSQSLDVIIPENRTKKRLPVIVFIHGGGWKGGDKFSGQIMLDPFISSGEYIGVSINYRLSSEAKWPSQIYDCNAAIRWIKANAKEYGIDKNKICVWGTSAGGHMVAMLAVSAKNTELYGTVGDHLNESSDFTCAIEGFGPTDFLLKESVSIIPKLVHNNYKDVSYNVYNLLEGIEQQAKNASPVYAVNKEAKPLFIYHGKADSLVNIKHSERMFSELKRVEAKNTYFTKVEGLKHEPIIPTGLKTNIQFFLEHFLKNKNVELPVRDTVSIDK
jgi:acetyl esterase/lipase